MFVFKNTKKKLIKRYIFSISLFLAKKNIMEKDNFTKYEKFISFNEDIRTFFKILEVLIKVSTNPKISICPDRKDREYLLKKGLVVIDIILMFGVNIIIYNIEGDVGSERRILFDNITKLLNNRIRSVSNL